MNTPTLTYFDETKTTRIVCDASPIGLGAVLTQCDEDGNNSHVIAYASHSLTDVEQCYSQTEREALSIVWACEHFHLYIYGHAVTVVTDHKPLVSIFGNPNSKPPPRIERWALRLQPYQVTIVYRSGSANPADYLSRHPLKQDKLTSREEKVAEEYVNFITQHAIPKAMTLDEIRSASLADPTLQHLYSMLEAGHWNDRVGDAVKEYIIRSKQSNINRVNEPSHVDSHVNGTPQVGIRDQVTPLQLHTAVPPARHFSVLTGAV